MLVSCMLFLFSIKLNAVVIFNMCPVPFDEHFSFMIYDDNNWETILFMDEKKKTKLKRFNTVS